MLNAILTAAAVAVIALILCVPGGSGSGTNYRRKGGS